MDEKLQELTAIITSYLPQTEIPTLEKAFMFAKASHANQLRASGETYFSHCVSVATILTELKLDIVTITAALLHDTIEDTQVTLAQLRSEFGPEIAAMVEGLTKISSFHTAAQETAQAENWRKLLLAVTKDIRVIIIKLADRLHNLRTIKYLPDEKRKQVADESLHLYAPFAQRLGIYRWKSEMEDLSFEILFPDNYRVLLEQWEKRSDVSSQSVELWGQRLREKIDPTGIPFQLSARPKSLYGIFKKMERQGKTFLEIEDLVGLRLVTDSVSNCYGLLGIVNTQFSTVPGSFTDYISLPKVNRYQSLHTTIKGEDNSIAEIQIRTEEMHRQAEYGICAHWRYKEKGTNVIASEAGTNAEIEEKLDWLRSMMEWQTELKDSREFMEAFKAECQFDEIFVFTPRGKVIKLPNNATPLDFAFAVHTEIGNTCSGAKVGNKMVTLDYKLKSGEICEVLTRKNAHPSEHWLEHVITARARSKIRKYLKDHPSGMSLPG